MIAAYSIALLVGVGLVAALATTVRDHTSLDDDGNVVPADIQGMAARAGVSVPVLALARVAASEAGGYPRIAKAGVCWVVVNEANRTRKTALDVILGSASTFGHQGTGGRGFVASSRDPGAVDFDVADQVDSGAQPDPTGGALHFDSPGAYKDSDTLTAQERADNFAAARIGEGFRLVTLDGVSERAFRFWGRA
jgi:hypothetical protein